MELFNIPSIPQDQRALVGSLLNSQKNRRRKGNGDSHIGKHTHSSAIGDTTVIVS